MSLSAAVSTSPVSTLLTRYGTLAARSSTLHGNLWRLATASFTIPAITLNVPSLVSDIWEGILKAVPKKKTSHSKKRHRQLAGKALKDVNSVVRCSGCGKPKKSHFLCPYCVAEIRQGWRERDAESAAQTMKTP